jgi:hypothetical protein
LSVRRFPPPWSIDELEACFVVRDHDGQRLAYVYFEDEPGRRSAPKVLERNEARRIAVNIAKLPEPIRAITQAAIADAIEQKGRGDIISIQFSNWVYVHHVRRDDVYERLAKLKETGSINDDTPVEFAVFHTIVRPPRSGELRSSKGNIPFRLAEPDKSLPAANPSTPKTFGERA